MYSLDLTKYLFQNILAFVVGLLLFGLFTILDFAAA